MAIALVQQAQQTIGGAGAASAAFTLGAAPISGNLLVCVWEHNNANPTMSGTGVTWTRQPVFVGDANHDNTALWTGVVGASGSTTQTFTPSVSTADSAGIILEFSGVQQVVDGTPPTPTNVTSATPSVTSNTPGVAGDLAVAFVGQASAIAPTATPAGWTTVTAATNSRRLDGAWLDLGGSSAAVTPQWTFAASKFALLQIVLIKLASTAGNVQPFAPVPFMSNGRI